MRNLVKTSIVVIGLMVSAMASAKVMYMGGYNFSLDFHPSEEVRLKNPVFWSNSSHCTFYSDDKKPMTFNVTLLSHSATVDGVTLKRGKTIKMSAKNKKRIYIQVSGSAEVKLVNLKGATAHADCN